MSHASAPVGGKILTKPMVVLLASISWAPRVRATGRFSVSPKGAKGLIPGLVRVPVGFVSGFQLPMSVPAVEMPMLGDADRPLRGVLIVKS